MAPLIELQNVTRSFPCDPEVQALKSVSFSVEKGEYVSVVGHSGSGKSTMLNILGLLDRPTVGEYRIDGHLTGTLSEAERAAVRALRIGFVFQSFHLLPRRSVLNNVLMPMMYNGTPRAEREARAVEALERVGLAHRMNFLPGTLSGGEKQRCAIARAVASRPSLLLADEPTGALDIATADSIMDLFDEFNAAGQTIIVITHSAEVASRGRRTLAINDDRLTEIPAVAALSAAPTLVETPVVPAVAAQSAAPTLVETPVVPAVEPVETIGSDLEVAA